MTKITGHIGKRIAVALAAVTLLFSIAACGGKKPASKEDLTGTWQQLLSDGTETIQLTSDGRYISDIKLYAGTSTHNTHTWDYSDGKLTVHYTNLGVDSTYDVAIEGNQMKLTRNGTTTVYTKK